MLSLPHADTTEMMNEQRMMNVWGPHRVITTSACAMGGSARDAQETLPTPEPPFEISAH